MPGSLVIVEKGKNPGEINVSYERSRQNKEWVKTVLIGSDQAVVFAMLKQSITANYNERMAIAVTDTQALDDLWEKKVYLKEPIQKTITRIMRELAKLNPQGHVHAQELYAAVNIVRRCPPTMVVHQLLSTPTIEHLGDLYFKFIDKEK
jgi:HrpA-like RNA helicase